MSKNTDKQRLFVVAGTDTEIGKTTAACALLAALRDRGDHVRGIKPVESGTIDQPSPNHEDGRRLAAAAGQNAPEEALQRLRAPLAPPVAARDEGVELRPDQWFEIIGEYAEDAQLTLVEGAGGLLSPLADGVDTRTTAIKLDAPVLLVAQDSLGTLNHTFLTMEALETAGIDVAGVIFSAPETPDASTGRNAEAVQKRHPELAVASLPRIEDDKAGAAALEEAGIVDQLVNYRRTS